jgi:hypothetical protein
MIGKVDDIARLSGVAIPFSKFEVLQRSYCPLHQGHRQIQRPSDGLRGSFAHQNARRRSPSL